MKNEEGGDDGEVRWFIQVICVLLRNRFLVLFGGIMKGKAKRMICDKAKLKKVAITAYFKSHITSRGNATIAFK